MAKVELKTPEEHFEYVRGMVRLSFFFAKKYLEKKFPEDTFEVLHVGQKIKSLEKAFAPALEAVGKAEALVFSYPVYTFIAPCQLHRFI
ncbi:MAG: hypothetical protein IKC08_01015, partial [Lentisphaeria bacterium]|nr:hypothetical protein [Lentisphaeria bacterium]